MFQDVFAQAWSISAIKEFDKEDSDGFISNMYSMMNFAMVLICSCIMIMNIPFARILYSNDFFKAWKFVPPLLISVVFNAMGLFIGSIFTAVKDTKILSLTTVVGAVVNTICNLFFIWFWGAYGAAIATMIGYFVVYLMRHVVLKKYIHLKLHWCRDICVYGLLLVQMIIASVGMRLLVLQLLVLVAILALHHTESKNLLLRIKSVIRR
jgi:O-antigen/teichoic acid export membrane protein